MKIFTLVSVLTALSILLAINFPIQFILSVIFSNILNISAHIGGKVRSHKLGFAICNSNEEKILNFLIHLSSIYPVFNVIVASLNYFRVFTSSDETFLNYNTNSLMPFKETIKEYDLASTKEDEIEYEEIKKKEYDLSKKMVNVEELVDEIMMNTNLNNKEKEELLRELRTKVLFNKKLTSKKIKKLIK